jgi:hypothetical protein
MMESKRGMHSKAMYGIATNRNPKADRYAPDRSGGGYAINLHHQNRSPLSPLANTEAARLPLTVSNRDSTGPRQPQQVFFSTSDISNDPYFDEETACDRFELMNVTVVIYRVTGVVCETESTPKRRSTFGIRDKSVSSRISGNSPRMSPVTISSVGPSGADVAGPLIDHGWAPTTAVVSYRKNTYSSQTALETFLPSIPIAYPSRYVGPKYRFEASWPSEQAAKDESAITRSSVVVSRCNKQETYVPGALSESNYVHEKIELQVHLSRGTELLKLGSATVMISGDEEGEHLMIVPIKPSDQKKKNTKKRMKTKSIKQGYFSGDLSRRFYLDEHSTMRVGVRILPQAALDSTEGKERNENQARNSLPSGELKNMVQKMGHLNVSKGAVGTECHSTLRHQFEDNKPNAEAAVSRGLFHNLFSCGALCNTDTSANVFQSAGGVPVEIRAIDLGQLAVESIISSVSESTDGSDADSEEGEDSDDSDDSDGSDDSEDSDDSDDIEAEINNIARIVEPLRRFT